MTNPTELIRVQARRTRTVVSLLGAALGVLVLHPLTMLVSWLEFRSQLGEHDLLGFLGSRLSASFTLPMLPMTAGYAAAGSGLALLFAHIAAKLTLAQQDRIAFARELTRHVPSLIKEGESESLEFKAALRWDLHKGRVNKQIEHASLKTIAGFANAEGGNLLLGVDDSGVAVGLALDYKTLRRKDRDGFEQYIFTLVSRQLGGDVCPLVHVVFISIDDADVARLVIEAAPRPVYLSTGDQEQFYVRAGNSTRELGVREAVDYIAARWPAERRPRSSSTAIPIPAPAATESSGKPPSHQA